MSEAAQDLMMLPYEEVPGVRWSRLKTMRVSPKHYRHALLAEEGQDDQKRRIGKAAHTLALEPHMFEREYVVAPVDDRRLKAYKDFVKNDSGTRVILSPTEHARAQGIVTEIRGNPRAFAHINGQDVKREFVVTWTDPDTGVLCKAKPDTVNGHLVELKTSGVIRPDKFVWVVYEMGYHGQVAFYLDGLRANGYELDRAPAIIMAENDAPFDVAPYVVPERVIDKGRELYKHLLGRVRDCDKAGWWPGVAGDGELTLELPARAYEQTFEGVELGF